MKTANFLSPKGPFNKHDFNTCTEKSSSFDPLFTENINDIADTMAEIMIICGIHRCKAKDSKTVIVKAFQFYDTKKHSFNVEEETSIYRNDIVNDFQCKCLMNRIEALLAYCIVKRAVKAFYHGTPDHSIRSPVTEAVILREQEFIWQHAARRTIQLFKRYESMFFEAHCNYAEQILNIYSELYGRLKSRADSVILKEYHPRDNVRKIVIGIRSLPKLESEKQKCVAKCENMVDFKEYEANFSIKRSPIKSCLNLPSRETEILRPPEHVILAKKEYFVKNVDLNLPRCYKCNCPKVFCDCNIEHYTGVVATDCSQGPFECQWVRMDKHEKTEPCIEKRELHQCPVDCHTLASSSESDEFCVCSGEMEDDDFITESYDGNSEVANSDSLND